MRPSGDLTQLATAALVARSREPLSVAIGAAAALWAVTVVAAVIEAQVGRFPAPSLLKWRSVALFATVGLLVMGTTLLVRFWRWRSRGARTADCRGQPAFQPAGRAVMSG